MPNSVGEVVAVDTEGVGAWVLSTKRLGDRIGGWKVTGLSTDKTRLLEQSERCQLTSYCYPSGVKLVRATLQKVEL